MILKSQAGRGACVAAALVLLGCLGVWLYLRGPGAMPWDCIFHRLTGLQCPGCGMTRATSALLHGDLPGAMRMNVVGIFVMPVALAGLSLEVAGWVRGRPLPWRLSFGRYTSLSLAILITAFWILRNLPWWPFTLLAPH